MSVSVALVRPTDSSRDRAAGARRPSPPALRRRVTALRIRRRAGRRAATRSASPPRRAADGAGRDRRRRSAGAGAFTARRPRASRCAGAHDVRHRRRALRRRRAGHTHQGQDVFARLRHAAGRRARRRREVRAATRRWPATTSSSTAPAPGVDYVYMHLREPALVADGAHGPHRPADRRRRRHRRRRRLPPALREVDRARLVHRRQPVDPLPDLEAWDALQLSGVRASVTARVTRRAARQVDAPRAPSRLVAARPDAPVRPSRLAATR